MPVLDPSVPPAGWRLSAEGRRAATALRGSLPPHAERFASSEPKLKETLDLALPGPHHVDSRCDEVRRPAEPVGGDVRPARRAWVAGRLDDRHREWETGDEAAARFDAAVRAAPPGDLVVAAHDMIIVAWLVAAGHVPSGDPAARFWDALALPDVVEIPRPGLRARRAGRDSAPRP